MKTTKPNKNEIIELAQAAQLIKTGNRWAANGKKASENGKAAITEWLAKSRQIKLADEPIDEVILIEEICVIQIGAQTRFRCFP